MVEEKRSGGVYAHWHESTLRRYNEITDQILKKIVSLPRYPYVVTNVDIDDLIEIMEALDLSYDPGDLEDTDIRSLLKIRENFYLAKGSVIREIFKRSEKDLMPKDPWIELAKDLKLERDTIGAKTPEGFK